MKKLFFTVVACLFLVSANAKQIYFTETFHRFFNSGNLDVASSKIDSILYFMYSPMSVSLDTAAAFIYYPAGGYSAKPDYTTPNVYLASKWVKLNGNVENYVAYDWFYNASAAPAENVGAFITARVHPDSAWVTIASMSGTQMGFDNSTAVTGTKTISGKIPSELIAGTDSVQIAALFKYSTNTTVQFFFYLDNISFLSFDDVSGQENVSLAVSAPGSIIDDISKYNITATITNESDVVVDSVVLGYIRNGGEIKYQRQVLSNPLQMFGTSTFNFGKDNFIVGENNFEMWIAKLNNVDFERGELGTVNFSTYIPNPADAVYPIKYLVEHFTSSTCGPCAGNNVTMNPFYEQQEAADKLIYIKYQMNWPGNGDPYYVAEDGGVRRDYYGVNAVPEMYGNAAVKSGKNEMAADITELEGKKAYVGVTLSSAWMDSVSNTEKNININYSITSKLNTEATVHTIVLENVTYKNKRTNGETEFHHVVMKMLPNGGGNTIFLKKDSTYNFSYTYNMAATHVEEISDLKLVVFVQSDVTKEIFANAQRNVSPSKQSATPTINPAISSFSDSVFVTITSLTEGAEIYYTTDGTAPTSASTLYTGGFYINTTTTIKAIAVKNGYLDSEISTTTYTKELLATEKLSNAIKVKVYPNPVTDYVTVESPVNSTLFLYNSVGMLVYKGTGDNKKLSVASMPSGVYILKVVSDKGIDTQKIIKR